MNQETIGPMLMSVAMAVRVSGISKSELYRRLSAGELHGKMVGNKVRIKLSDLAAMIDKLPNYGG